MIKLKCNLILILWGSFSLLMYAANGPWTSQLVKQVHQSFDVQNDALLGVQNKYGNLKITTWNKNKIEVDVFIRVKSNNENKGQQLIDNIKIDFSSSASKVGIQTVYPDQENSSSWWSSWWSNDKNIAYEVHYTIKAPRSASVHLINKFGDIKMTDIDGDADITNKYGDVFVGDLGGDLSLDFGYGKASFGTVKDAAVDIKNSTLKIEECNDIDVNSKYSDITIGSCDQALLDSKHDTYIIKAATEIQNDGKYDTFKIGTVGEFSSDTKNSTININTLLNTLDIETKYGTITVDEMAQSVTKVNLESKYTDFTFGVAHNFLLHFIGDRTDLNIAEPFEKISSRKDSGALEAKIHRGNKNATTRIKIESKYGSLVIR